MIDWVCRHPSLKYVLEPAFGLGVFSRLLLSRKPEVEITGFDIDPVILNEARNSFKNFPNVNLVLADYLFNDWQNQYDGILCNPPYFKFHDYENKRTLKEIRERLKVNLNGFTNIYTLFLLKSIYQLKDGGRAAYIIPSEFLNSDYGTYVKRYLIDSQSLNHILIFDFKENIFDDALTTSAILLLSKDASTSSVSFTTIESRQQFEQAKIQIKHTGKAPASNIIRAKELNPDIKWRAYYQKQLSTKYKHLIPFKQVARVVRGIATGSNEYFTFNREKVKHFNIPQSYLLPCMTKSKDAHSPFFTKEQFEHLVCTNANVYLFHAGKSPKDPAVWNYIKLGEKKGVHKKFLTSKRTPWYINENRPPSPIWVSVFNRSRVKFIRNEAGIYNLTAFHCVYLKSDLFSNIEADLLFAYLLTNIAREIFSDNRREYGDGLKKFEPNDLNNGLMLDLSRLSREEQEEIKILYHAYRKSVLENKENQAPLEEIENILKGKYLRR
ncbi:MAG: methyltransferase domain-containing protein [Bacteroidetes bacterium]|nr:MAG: methyltransferase domain-containing protein [Bacteroidota bacterium]